MDEPTKLKMSRYSADMQQLIGTILYAHQDADTQFITMVVDRGDEKATQVLSFAGNQGPPVLGLEAVLDGLRKASVIVSGHIAAGNDIPKPPTDAIH